MKLLALACERAGRPILAGAAIISLLCAYLAASRLLLEPNRNDLSVSNSAFHQRYVAFTRDFPVENNAIVIVASQEPDVNQRVVDSLAARLRGDSVHFAAVYDKIDTRFARERVLQFLPTEDTERMGELLRSTGPALALISGRLDFVYLLRDLNRQVQSLLSRAADNLPAQELRQARQAAPGARLALPFLTTLVDDLSGAVQAGEPYRSRWQELVRSQFAHYGVRLQGIPEQIYLQLEGGKMYLILVRPRSQLAAANDPDNYVVRLRALLDQERATSPGVEIGLTGKPVIDYDQVRTSAADTSRAMLLSLGGVCLLFALTFNHLRRPMIAIVCLMYALLWTLGFAALALGHLDTLTVIALPMLVGLGIDFAIQIIARYEEELSGGAEPVEAMRITLTDTGSSVVMAGITISLAFSATALTGLAAMKELALLAGVGVMLCVIAMLVVLPSWLMRSEQRRQYAPSWRRWIIDVLRTADNRMLEYAPLIVVLSVCLAGVGLSQIHRIPFDANLVHLQAGNVPSMQWEERLAQASGGGLLPAALLATDLNEARRWEVEAAKLPSVASALSVATLLPVVDNARLAAIRRLQLAAPHTLRAEVAVDAARVSILRVTMVGLRQALLVIYPEATQAAGEPMADLLKQLIAAADRFIDTLYQVPLQLAAQRLQAYQHGLLTDLGTTLGFVQSPLELRPMQPSDLPPVMRDNVISADGRIMVAVFPSQDIWEADSLERFVTDVRQIDANVTGFPVEVYDSEQVVAAGYTHAVWFAIAAVFIVTYLHLLRLVPTLLAMVPAALGLSWVLSLQAHFNIPFNMSNQVVVPLLLGIGAANGIYVVRRIQQAGTPMMLGNSTGRALLLSNGMALVGFASLLVAKYPGIYTIGLIVAMGLVCLTINSLIVLPSCFELYHRYSQLGLWPRMAYSSAVAIVIAVFLMAQNSRLPVTVGTTSPPVVAVATGPVQTIARPLSLSRDFGVSETTVKKVLAIDTATADALRSEPLALRNAYRALPSTERVDFDRGLQGSTHILFITISDRKAFITGSVMGQNIADAACEDLDKELKGGKLSPGTHDRLTAVFQAARPLTPEQRGAFMDLLDVDAAALRSPAH